MDVDKAISDLARTCGISPEFKDLEDVSRPTSKETNLALLKACGWELDDDALINEAIKYSKSKKMVVHYQLKLFASLKNIFI
ncbi:MAG: hypothetical protein AB8B49_00900 [Nitratireductor sp.]